jgi:hypothetical protein
MGAEAETVGSVGILHGTAPTFNNTTTGSGFGFARGVQKQNSKYAVIQYVVESELQPASPPSASTPGITPSIPKPDQGSSSDMAPPSADVKP